MLDFDKMIDAYLWKETYQKQIGRYYPSEIGSCVRKIWYTYKLPKQFDPKIVKILAMGDMLHEFVVKVLQSEKTKDVQLLQHEFPIKMQIDDFLVSGRVDNLILIKLSGKTVLVEVKSCKDIIWIKGPQPHHTPQLQFYMHATGVHEGLLLYIDKASLQTKVFTIPYDESLCKTIEDRFRDLHRDLSQSVLPLPEAKQKIETKWMCKWCEYKLICDKDSMAWS
jgi:CRISPR/Cas system-associated exonuclease Cas4 (RecB family)